MREISLDDEPTAAPVDTFLIYGDTGTGKTTWSAGLPRLLVLAVDDEGGFASLKGLTEDQVFEPGTPFARPIVWGLSEMNDMAAACEKAKPLIASKRIMSISISSLTFYADLYLAHLSRTNPGGDPRQIYGALGTHLRDLRVKIHSLGVNVVWEALADHPEPAGDGKPGHLGRPLIPGKQADKFGAGVGFLFHTRFDERREGGKVVGREFKQYTQPYGGYLARTRVGQADVQLPNPLIGGYKEFLTARGYDVDEVRKNLPKVNAAVSVAVPVSAPITAQKPPITNPPKTVSPASSAVKPATAATK